MTYSKQKSKEKNGEGNFFPFHKHPHVSFAKVSNLGLSLTFRTLCKNTCDFGVDL
jgi:hypothetical protein